MRNDKTTREALIRQFKYLRYLAAPALVLTLWLLSSRSTLPLPSGVFGLDKLVHFAAYAALAFALALWPGAPTWRLHPVRTAIIIIALASAYGAIDELHQSYVPGRNMSVYDWIADTLGAGFGVGGFAWWRVRRQERGI